MTKRNKEPDPFENLLHQEGLMQEQLAGEYNAEELVRTFSAFEVAVGAATKAREESLEGGFNRLASFSEQGRTLAGSVGDVATASIFGAKNETYRSFLETVAEIPAKDPEPTDTSRRKMSGGKGLI